MSIPSNSAVHNVQQATEPRSIPFWVFLARHAILYSIASIAIYFLFGWLHIFSDSAHYYIAPIFSLVAISIFHIAFYKNRKKERNACQVLDWNLLDNYAYRRLWKLQGHHRNDWNIGFKKPFPRVQSARRCQAKLSKSVRLHKQGYLRSCCQNHKDRPSASLTVLIKSRPYARIIAQEVSLDGRTSRV